MAAGLKSYRRKVYVALKPGVSKADIEARSYTDYRPHATFFGVLDNQTGLIKNWLEPRNNGYTLAELLSLGYYDTNVGETMTVITRRDGVKKEYDVICFFRQYPSVRYTIYKSGVCVGEADGYACTTGNKVSRRIKNPHKLLDCLGFSVILGERYCHCKDYDNYLIDIAKVQHGGMYLNNVAVEDLIDGMKARYRCVEKLVDGKANLYRLDVDEVAGEMTTSQQGIDMICNFEMSRGTLIGWQLGEVDVNTGAITGIYPYYFFNNKGTKENPIYISDGGMTFGYGHYVSKDEYQGENAVLSEQRLVNTYAPGASITPPYVPSNGIPYRVPGSKLMPINIVNDLKRDDLKYTERAVNSFLNKHGILLKQHQFDVLVSFSIHYGGEWWGLVPEKVLPKFIREGAGVYDPMEVIEIFKRHDDVKRREQEAMIFNNGY